MAKIEVEIQNRDWRFLQAFSTFTGKPIKELVEEHVDSLPGAILGAWPSIIGVAAKELSNRYKLDDADEEEA